MLAAQIPESFWKRLSAEVKIDLKVVGVTLAERTSEETRYSKLALVERYLRDEGEVGFILDIGESSKFFSGKLAMQWGPYLHHQGATYLPGEPMVWFAGETEETIVGLGGSMKHMIGETERTVPDGVVTPGGYPTFTSRSNMYGIVDMLRTAETQNTGPSDPRSTDMISVVAATTRDALFAGKMARVPPTTVEFVAVRLLEGRITGKHVVLGSPIFVATP
jgi:hypothetical protein